MALALEKPVVHRRKRVSTHRTRRDVGDVDRTQLDGDGIYLNNCELGFHGPIDAGPDVLFFVSPDGARETACGSGALR